MKILLATPIQDSQVLSSYHMSIIDLLGWFGARRPEVAFENRLLGVSLITQARNVFATHVLMDDSYSHLLFIDSDMGFRPQLIAKMLAFAQPFVGCICPARRMDYERLHQANRLMDDAHSARMLAQPYVGGDAVLLTGERGELTVRGDFVRARRAGTGILLLERQVLVRMRETYPELWTDDPEGHYRPLGLERGVFQPFESYRSPAGTFLGEDWAFSARWTDMGGEVWSCFTETIIHEGRERFTGNYAAKLRGRRAVAGTVVPPAADA